MFDLPLLALIAALLAVAVPAEAGHIRRGAGLFAALSAAGYVTALCHADSVGEALEGAGALALIQGAAFVAVNVARA